MKEKYNASQVSKVIDQALVYQCACPAQVCRAIFELRELHEYQIGELLHRELCDANGDEVAIELGPLVGGAISQIGWVIHEFLRWCGQTAQGSARVHFCRL